MAKYLFAFFILLFQLYGSSNVLVIHSYSQEYPWTKNQHNGFVEALKDSKNKDSIEIATEYLDSKRLVFDVNYKKAFANYLSMKYSYFRPDIIYVTDDNALNFIIEFKGAIFLDTPIVFSGINNLTLHNKLDQKIYNGVFESKDIGKNIELINTFSPQTREVFFIGDDSLTYKAMKEDILTHQNEFTKMKFHFLSSFNIKDIQKALKDTPPRTFVMLTTIGAFSYDNGKKLSIEKVIKELSTNPNLIFMCMEDAYMVDGVIGGFVTSGKTQGEMAASIIMQYFEGVPFEQTSIKSKDSNIYFFNAKEITKARLILSSYIARNANVINKPESFFSKYEKLILNSYFIILLLFFITTTILILIIIQKNRLLKANSHES